MYGSKDETGAVDIPLGIIAFLLLLGSGICYFFFG